MVFPSAYEQKEDLGIRYEQVANGIFENRRNAPEAEAVVEAVLVHMREHPDESLGVVALNLEQREMIEELLDRRLREEAFAEALAERFDEGDEPFFIKNLENVQGDERDVIFVSCTYGPDPRGNQYQRFGPINGENGHRRLNVLFTRAKKRVVVFGSLDPDRIEVGPGSAWGVRAFKGWLQFARSGTLEETKFGTDRPTNDFEASVAALLSESGYQVVFQVGVSGFWIDLAVRHPFKPGAFLLGIECDGASYHSGRSARDRDRLRQEILENLGWKIHRIWSTDWFKSRQNEIRKLLARVEALLAEDPDAQRERARTNPIQLLKGRLIDFREKVIKPAFPATPVEKCLLREALLEEFVKHRPTNRDEWFCRIPAALRASTETSQVGQFLGSVLEIIAGCCE
jgi:very-short-patch-repair endonuclease